MAWCADWMAGAEPARGRLNMIRGHSLSIDDKRMRNKLTSFLMDNSYGFPAGYPAGDMASRWHGLHKCW